MDLFELQNGRIIPSVHALMVEPYKSMWAKDTSKEKTEVTKVFSYIELLCSPKKSNPFHGYAEDVRPTKIKQNIWGDEFYQSPLFTSLEIIGAVEAYRDNLLGASPGYDLYLSAISAAQKLKEFLNNVDLEAKTNSGSLVLKPADVTRALNDIPETIRSLQEGREKVLAELKESAKTRNNRDVGLFER